MLGIIGDEPSRRNTASAERHGYAPQPDFRPRTMFEDRDLKSGHDVRDLVFKRI